MSKKQIQIVSLILLIIMSLQILIPEIVNATDIKKINSEEVEDKLDIKTETEDIDIPVDVLEDFVEEIEDDSKMEVEIEKNTEMELNDNNLDEKENLDLDQEKKDLKVNNVDMNDYIRGASNLSEIDNFLYSEKLDFANGDFEEILIDENQRFKYRIDFSTTDYSEKNHLYL